MVKFTKVQIWFLKLKFPEIEEVKFVKEALDFEPCENEWIEWIDDCLTLLFTSHLNIRTERQYHGFEYEQMVIQKYNLYKTERYTDCYDAMYMNIPVQIKCIKHGSSIELGDYKRNKNKKEDFILIIGFWTYKKDNIVSEKIININNAIYKTHLQFDHDKEMFDILKLITNDRTDDKSWREYRIKYARLWPEENLINIRFKRDHKKQKRIQCAISWKNFQKFIGLFNIVNLKSN